jgi:predicted esterase
VLTACARRRLHDAANGREGSARTWAKRLKALDLPWCKLVVPSGFPSGSGGARCWFEPGSDAGLHATVEYLHALVGAELAAGVPPWRIVVGGAGAGGTAALLLALLLDCRLGGAVALGAGLPRTVALEPSAASGRTPVLLARRPDDARAQEAVDTLRALGLRADAYPAACAPRLGLRERLTRRWRPWGSRFRGAVGDFLWAALPDDLAAIPLIDLAPAPAPDSARLARPARFLPLHDIPRVTPREARLRRAPLIRKARLRAVLGPPRPRASAPDVALARVAS